MLNKIIYFDRETIRNILQEKNQGQIARESKTSPLIHDNSEIKLQGETGVKIKLPLMTKLGIMFTGQIDASYMVGKDNATTITSAEISEFNSLMKHFTEFKKGSIRDLKNSSTALRMAGA